MKNDQKRLDLSSIRQRLNAVQGKRYWRCLEELAGRDEFQEFLHNEFPRLAAEWAEGLSRRQFLTLMGASLALAGLGGCARPTPEPIVPYVRQPEEIVPGRPLYFASAMPLSGGATGVLVESHEGRPTKIEGNPDHPASLGATDAFTQASILTLYDPDRSQTVTHMGRIRSWEDAVRDMRTALEKKARLRILTETVISPTLARQLEAVLKKYPTAKWHQYEPVNRDMARDGAERAFGKDVHPVYHFDKADVVLSLDADFLSCGPGHLRYVRDFMNRRRLAGGKTEMNRLYAVECTPTPTGAKADHRLALRPSAIHHLAGVIAAELGMGEAKPEAVAEFPKEFVAAVVRDLRAQRGSSLVLAGEQQLGDVHALAHGMNEHLGNIGKTVTFIPPVEANPVDKTGSLSELLEDMKKGLVDLLVILGGNPVYTAPAYLGFSELLAKAPLRVHLGLYEDETSALCHWHIPEAHYLEAWSDCRAYDGTVSIIQPLVAPLYGGKSAHELLSVLLEPTEQPAYESVRETWRSYWKERGREGTFESVWKRTLHDGVMADTASKAAQVSVNKDQMKQIVDEVQQATGNRAVKSLEFVFRPDPTIYDGRFANNGWLQELPKPLTNLTWDNAVLMSARTAESLGVSYHVGLHGGEHGEILADTVELRVLRSSSFAPIEPVIAPAWIVPGHADGCLTLPLGYGRTHAGKVGSGAGFNAYRLRNHFAPWNNSGLQIWATGTRYPLACTQYHFLVENRDLVRSANLAEYRKHPHLEAESEGPLPEDPKTKRQALSLYNENEHEYTGYKWGMAIDLTACVGCGACVVACQAENNIPVVGKEQVLRGREMHWLRVDRYYKGDLDNPETYFQPVPCMHCENAPCELVCPVGATVHSTDGLNDMVYNRCVGTRYCSNNCPYKVRRFNFLQFADFAANSLKLLHNPEVTVRSRGVMEKCTYCVQRIRAAEIEAKRQDRREDPNRPGVTPIIDGEVLTACQAVCPAEAIVFGDMNDPRSRVAKLKAEPRNYGLLAELNTRPRTTYLAAIRNAAETENS